MTERRPVWNALSTLFLDTDTSLDRQWRAQRLAESAYSLEELEAILLDEVYPACAINFLSVAGEWAGFDAEWLEGRIRKQLRSPFRILRRFSIGRRMMRSSNEWTLTKLAVSALRRE